MCAFGNSGMPLEARAEDLHPVVDLLLDVFGLLLRFPSSLLGLSLLLTHGVARELALLLLQRAFDLVSIGHASPFVVEPRQRVDAVCVLRRRVLDRLVERRVREVCALLRAPLVAPEVRVA